MNYLVAVDGSSHSDIAVSRAVRDTERAGANLTAIHVVNPEVYTEEGYEPVSGLSKADQKIILEDIEDAENRGDRILEGVSERAGEIDIDTELLYGDPPEQIVGYAEQGGFDLIYIGHRGLSDRHEELLGSVANEVVKRAEIPVMVVR